MRPISKFSINQFRGITDLTLDGLGDINILVGDNNVGKTSILEAICCWHAPQDINNIVMLARTRIEAYLDRTLNITFDAFYSLFPYSKMNDEKYIDLSITFNNNTHSMMIRGGIEKRIMQVAPHKNFEIDNEMLYLREINEEVEEVDIECFVGVMSLDKNTIEICVRSDGYRYREITNPFIEMHYVSPGHHLIYRNITRGTMYFNKDILKLIKLFDNEIIDYGLEMNILNKRPIEMIHHKKLGVVPVFTFGDGLKRVLTLARYIVQAKNGVLLIDEIDTSIHVSILTEIFQWFIRACKKFNVQVFASTHSLEALKCLTDIAIQDKQSDLVVFKIEHYNENFFAKRYSEEKLGFIINEMGQDVR